MITCPMEPEMKGEEVGSNFDLPLTEERFLDTGISFLLVLPEEFGMFLFVRLVFLDVSFCIG